MASNISTVRITDIVQASLLKAVNTEMKLTDSLTEFVEKQVKEIGKKMGVQVEYDPLTPEQEAAARLDGSFDPGKLNFRVQVPRAVDFIEMTFVIDKEEK